MSALSSEADINIIRRDIRYGPNSRYPHLLFRVFGVMHARSGKPSGVGNVPPTFIYFLALSVWIPLACLVWVLAGVMALNRGTRRKGSALALAMAATFPSVFLFQAAAAPLIAAMVFGVAWLSGILDPVSTVTHVTNNRLVVAMISGIVLLAFFTMLTVSVVGFFEGWLLGWRYAHGERFRDVIRRGPTARFLQRLGFRKPHQAG